jgi:hypothetical protein
VTAVAAGATVTNAAAVDGDPATIRGGADRTGLTVFDRTTQVIADPATSGVFAVWIDEAWSSLRGVHGGYMTALLVRAAQAGLDGRAVRTVSVNFLRAGRVGDAVITITPVRTGRLVSVLTATLVQDHGEVATARITATTPTTGTEWDAAVDLALPAIEACLANNPPPGIRHFEHAVVRLDPASMPFSHQERARIGGYVRPVERRPIDAPWLAMLLDWFPPSPFTRIDPPTGGVSVDFTVHLHRTFRELDDDEWLTGEFEVQHSVGGLALEHGTIVAPGGVVLGESFHTRLTG